MNMFADLDKYTWFLGFPNLQLQPLVLLYA